MLDKIGYAGSWFYTNKKPTLEQAAEDLYIVSESPKDFDFSFADLLTKALIFGYELNELMTKCYEIMFRYEDESLDLS